jgi:Transposase DDE domain
MRHAQYPRSSVSPQVEAVRLLESALTLKQYGRHLSSALLARVMIWICVARATCSEAASRQRLPVAVETLRKGIMASLPEMDDIVDLVPASLNTRCRRYLQKRKRGCVIAIDLHHQPYYGRPVADVYRGKACQGTKQFWSVATAAVVEKGKRVTLAVVPVRSNRMVDVLQDLWAQLEKLSFRIRWLLLDRGFYGAPVVTWLQEHNVRFIMPMIRRGNARRKTGTTPFFRKGRQGFATYTWRQRKRGAYVKVKVVMVPHPHDRRRRPLVYVANGRLATPEQCHLLYKRRFGIETSYREAKQTRGWTTSHNPRWRRLLQVLSFVIRNLWILAEQVAQHASKSQPLRYAVFIDHLRQHLDLQTQSRTILLKTR